MRILVVGGAGYIGSHMVKLLGTEGCRITVVDDLSSGHADAVLAGDLVRGDMGDPRLLETVLSGQDFDAVYHFASLIQVGESTVRPGAYYETNVGKTFALLHAMARHGVRHFIFSSSAAVYGTPSSPRLEESHLLQPINPYGRTKAMVEAALPDFAAAYGLKYACLRYFNAAGADPEGQLGERHDPETHLIPLVLRAALGRSGPITIFGHDYNTPDGTCIRDYVHVSDLCQAHWLALQALRAGLPSRAYNLGSGAGYSVSEVIASAERVTGRKVPHTVGSRRPGDPPRLVADSLRARTELQWDPSRGSLDTIIADAWRWEQRAAR